ncbi:hypothetical protein JTE90_024653 [Oedothorax gibbosus]|uniref:Cryptochrome/DNA photolyase FAD-binding domain-containing protein n=1 Tax=Oedothorax gibbosus TaxID=931172 RepID=A0AAV6TQV5_9ARAC|nr:hypothetical protein JTE90_024653 [Oedothorax gibbosus]
MLYQIIVRLDENLWHSIIPELEDFIPGVDILDYDFELSTNQSNRSMPTIDEVEDFHEGSLFEAMMAEEEQWYKERNEEMLREINEEMEKVLLNVRLPEFPDLSGLKPSVWIGGETEALSRLERHLERKAWVASFGRPKMTAQSLLFSQTGLSPYLRFGSLSPRLFDQELTELYRKIKKVNPPLSFHCQLLMREFFYCAATNNPKFDHMVGNPMRVQIPWDHNSEALKRWSNGLTGFPRINAIMTQFREEGWIHLVARHAVACFLTMGDPRILWEEGMKVFDELLLDADWSVNAGQWMWLSCSSFFQQFFHLFCLLSFGRKADPNGDYIR